MKLQLNLKKHFKKNVVKLTIYDDDRNDRYENHS